MLLLLASLNHIIENLAITQQMQCSKCDTNVKRPVAISRLQGILDVLVKACTWLLPLRNQEGGCTFALCSFVTVDCLDAHTECTEHSPSHQQTWVDWLLEQLFMLKHLVTGKGFRQSSQHSLMGRLSEISHWSPNLHGDQHQVVSHRGLYWEYLSIYLISWSMI